MQEGTGFVLSKHARRQLRRRAISVHLVSRTMEHPDKEMPDAEDPGVRHRVKKFPGLGGIVLRVVYNFRNTPYRVVTAFFDRRLRRRRL